MTMSERTTRKRLIDQGLACSGWSPIQPFDQRARYDFGTVEEYPTTNGSADYVLFSDCRPIAIIEAYKLAVGF